MKKELKYIILEYSEDDSIYIDDLCDYIDRNSDEIIDFFEIKNFGEKVNVKLWDNVEEFRKNYKKTFKRDAKKWICGFAISNTINTLSLKEYKKTYSHENSNLEDLKKLVMHEFTHSAHGKVGNTKNMKWLTEGLATTLSHQWDNSEKKFDISLEQLLNDTISYVYYYTMFSYILEEYGKNYILKLIKNLNYLNEETPRLYEEIKSLYSSKTL